MSELPSDRVVVLNLQEFNSLVSKTFAKLYPAVARYTRPRPLSFEDLLELSHLVVRNPFNILSQKPLTLPTPGLPSLSATTLLPSNAEVFKTLQLIAEQFAAAKGASKQLTVKPPASDSITSPQHVSVAPDSRLPLPLASTASGTRASLPADFSASGATRPITPIRLRVGAPAPPASSTPGVPGPSADIYVAPNSALEPPVANIEHGFEDEQPTEDTAATFDQATYSNVLEQGLANIRTPEVPPQVQRPKTLQGNRKKQPKPTSKQKHQHTKSRRARRTSPIRPTTQATSPPTSPKASDPTDSRHSQPSAELSASGIPRRRAALQADESSRSAREKKTPPEWSEDSEDERAPQPSSPPRSTTRVARQELVITSSTESSDLSDVDQTFVVYMKFHVCIMYVSCINTYRYIHEAVFQYMKNT